jgi:hypothetical protein
MDFRIRRFEKQNTWDIVRVIALRGMSIWEVRRYNAPSLNVAPI